MTTAAAGWLLQTVACPPPPPPPPTPGVVKQDKSSGGFVDTTKKRADPQRVGMCSGERPIGAAKGKQFDTEALCQHPPPLQKGATRSLVSAMGPMGGLHVWGEGDSCCLTFEALSGRSVARSAADRRPDGQFVGLQM